MQQTTCSLEPAIGSRVHQHDLLSLVHKGFGKILAHQRKTWTWEVPHLSRSESVLRCWHFKNENLRCPGNTLGTIFASGCLGEVSALSSLTWHSLVIPMAVYYVRQQSFSHLCIFVCHKSVEDCCSKCPLPMIEPMSMLTQDDPSNTPKQACVNISRRPRVEQASQSLSMMQHRFSDTNWGHLHLRKLNTWRPLQTGDFYWKL